MDIIRRKDYGTVITMLKSGVHPYLVGPSGCGKTTIAQQAAEELGLNFYYTGAVESAFQLRGFKDAHGNVARTPFRDAYEHGGVFLFDELDASSPGAIVSVHAALDNGVLDAPDGMVKKHENFHYIAAANTWGHGATMEYMGRNALDGATLDRYAFVPMDYDAEMEAKVVAQKHPARATWPLVVQQARAAVRELQIRHVISPRASFNGAALLDAGMDVQAVFRAVVLKGMNEDDEVKVVKKIDFKATELKKMLEKGDQLSTASAAAATTLEAFVQSAARIETASKEMTGMMTRITGAMAQAADVLQRAESKVAMLNGLDAAAGAMAATARPAGP